MFLKRGYCQLHSCWYFYSVSPDALSSQHSKSNHSKLSHLLLRPRMSF